MSDTSVRSLVGKQFTIANQTATVVLRTTNDITYSFSPAGYTSGIFITKVIANASAAPALYLDVAVDTTTWVQYATLHPDLTTTANNRLYQCLPTLPIPQNARVRLLHKSTTTHLRFTVKAELFPK